MNGNGLAGPVAIAGAGIAGLSAAIALKLKGVPVSVFERETVLEPVGAGIQMGPNATRIMEGWTLDLLGASAEPEIHRAAQRDLGFAPQYHPAAEGGARALRLALYHADARGPAEGAPDARSGA